VKIAIDRVAVGARNSRESGPFDDASGRVVDLEPADGLTSFGGGLTWAMAASRAC
jgi:hypothetical protein